MIHIVHLNLSNYLLLGNRPFSYSTREIFVGIEEFSKVHNSDISYIEMFMQEIDLYRNISRSRLFCGMANRISEKHAHINGPKTGTKR